MKPLRLAILAAVFVPFLILTDIAVWQHGYIAVFTDAFTSTTHMQVFFDLCISCGLIGLWMLDDGKKRGRVTWPWVLALPFLGSVATLAYLIVRELQEWRRVGDNRTAAAA